MLPHDGLFACPICKAPLEHTAGGLSCSNDPCGSTFPIVDGRPVLINESNSLFRIADYQQAEPASVEWASRKRSMLDRVRQFVPSVSANFVAERNLREVARMIGAKASPHVLIVGAGEKGVGIGALDEVSGIRQFRTDVYIGENIDAVADAHDLPFLEGSFDAVVIQAVLEHVLDPYRCVAEIHRVLKPGGVVYADTPFLWPVHMGPHDFSRFSRSGHRRLFRYFTELDSGMSAGPAVGLVLSIRGFFCGLSNSRLMSGFVTYILPFFIFWIKYLDRLMLNKPSAADFAAAFYFVGERAEEPVNDDEIIRHHWSRHEPEQA